MTSIFLLGLRYRLPVLLLMMSVTVILAVGMMRLQIDTGFENVMDDQDPNRLAYERVIEEFGPDNRTMIFVSDRHMWSPQKLRSLKLLHDRLAASEVVSGVEDIFTLHNLHNEQGEVRSHLFVEDIPETQRQADRLRKQALRNPMMRGFLLSSSGDAVAILVQIDPVALNKLGHDHVYHTLQAALDADASAFERLFQLGSSRIQSEVKQTLLDDMQTLGPLSVLVFLCIVLLFVRSTATAIVPLMTAGLSIIWTLGMMGWAGIPLNVFSAMLPSLILVFGSADDTLMVATFLHEKASNPGRTRDYHVRHMMRQLGLPVLLAIMTTVLGFAINIYSDLKLVRDFAMAAAFAMAANGLLTILLIPQMLSLLDKLIRRGTVSSHSGLVKQALEYGKSSASPVKRIALVVFVITALLGPLLFLEAAKWHVSSDPISFFKQNLQLTDDAAEVHNNMAGYKTLYVTVESDSENAFLQPANLRKLSEIEDYAKRQTAFDRTQSLAGFFKLANREFHNGDGMWFRLPASKEMVTQYLLLIQRQDMEHYISHDFRTANIIVRYNTDDSKLLNRSIADLRDVAQEIAGPEMRVYLVGEDVMVHESARTLRKNMLEALGLLLLVIFLMMSATLTSLKGGLIVLLPCLLPVLAMFGGMSLLGIVLNPGVAMVAAIVIGVGINSTIHLVTEYSKQGRNSVDTEHAVDEVMREEAMPMAVTNIALVFGFSVLMVSDFALIAQFVSLIAATLLFMLLANLVILPLLLPRVRMVGMQELFAQPLNRQLLNSCRLFEGMSAYQIRKMIMISDVQSLISGASVVERGCKERCMYVVLNGELEQVRYDQHGEPETINLKAGELFGLAGFVNETERHTDVHALSAAKIMKLDFDKLADDLRHFPAIVSRLEFNLNYLLGEQLANKS